MKKQKVASNKPTNAIAGSSKTPAPPAPSNPKADAKVLKTRTKSLFDQCVNSFPHLIIDRKLSVDSKRRQRRRNTPVLFVPSGSRITLARLISSSYLGQAALWFSPLPIIRCANSANCTDRGADVSIGRLCNHSRSQTSGLDITLGRQTTKGSSGRRIKETNLREHNGVLGKFVPYLTFMR